MRIKYHSPSCMEVAIVLLVNMDLLTRIINYKYLIIVMDYITVSSTQKIVAYFYV